MRKVVIIVIHFVLRLGMSHQSSSGCTFHWLGSQHVSQVSAHGIQTSQRSLWLGFGASLRRTRPWKSAQLLYPPAPCKKFGLEQPSSSASSIQTLWDITPDQNNITLCYIYILYIMHRIQGHPPEAQRATAGGATWTGFVDFCGRFQLPCTVWTSPRWCVYSSLIIGLPCRIPASCYFGRGSGFLDEKKAMQWIGNKQFCSCTNMFISENVDVFLRSQKGQGLNQKPPVCKGTTMLSVWDA